MIYLSPWAVYRRFCDGNRRRGDLRRQRGAAAKRAVNRSWPAVKPRVATGKRRSGDVFCVCGGDGSVGSKVSEWGK
jgi:hypothetical protein